MQWSIVVYEKRKREIFASEEDGGSFESMSNIKYLTSFIRSLRLSPFFSFPVNIVRCWRRLTSGDAIGCNVLRSYHMDVLFWNLAQYRPSSPLWSNQLMKLITNFSKVTLHLGFLLWKALLYDLQHRRIWWKLWAPGWFQLEWWRWAGRDEQKSPDV